MKGNVAKKILCLVLMVTLTVGFTPTIAFAGWDDGTVCEFCGGYRFDDWLCDCGPHCSENADDESCYLENHCAECLEAVENSERCDTCYVCPDCMSDGNGPLHCAICGACDEGGYDVCEDCDVCMNCQVEAGTHCFDCGDCLESGSQCPDHPFELYQENHCESCALKCSGCEDKCFLGETFIDIYCEEHELCVVCATDDGLHCKECYGCYEDELCSECQKCDECGLESGEHCPECDAHGDDWCETGGEGTHCIECASEYLCEQCDVCTSCSGTEFCDECGLCIECCRENAESENCSCGEYCIESGNWEEHFCADCGTCFDESEKCETCEYCVECCEAQSECSEGLCVEDPDYDEHFCEQCQQCFHDVEPCESCQDAGTAFCSECCLDATEGYGCEHGYCTNSWQWDEHYCIECGKCYENCDHEAEAHSHTYDTAGNCTVCGYNKDGKPVIIKQPKSVTADPEAAAAVYTVEAMGDNLTYQWYYINLSTGEPVAMTEGIAYKGTTTKELSLTVQTGMCSLGKPVQIFCVVKNLKGNVTTNTVDFLVAHQYGKYQKDATHHWYACENCDKIKDQAEHRFNSWTILKQATQTEDGLKRRNCYDCGAINTVVIPKLPVDHVHDYSAAFVKTDTFHWTKCACGNENKDAMEEHDFGAGWVTTIQPTLTSVGEETRTCGICGYVETKEIAKQGHIHEFYNAEYLENHKDNGNSGYLVDKDGYIVNLYAAPYGKTDRTYHYAYCVVDGCDAYEKYSHKWYTEWYDIPTEISDGTYEKTCGDCFYKTTGTSEAGKYRITTKNCKANVQTAKPGSKVKISIYKDYPAGYFFDGDIEVSYTWGGGAYGTWAVITDLEHHVPDADNPREYWTFVMPELPTDKTTDWLNFYVEVEALLTECTEHDLEWANVKEATCGQPGYSGDYKCKLCNYIEERGHDTPATGEHGELIAEADYAGDCDHASYTGAKRCSVCDEIIVPREYHGKTHKVTKVPDSYIAATCTSKGQTAQYVCGRCGIVLTKSKSIAKLPHEWEKVEGTVTCIAAGTRDHVKCKSCGQLSLDGGTTILRNEFKLNSVALGHDYSIWLPVNGTIHQRTCTRDSTHIEIADHQFSGDTCTDCGYDKSAPHVCSPEVVGKVAATCTDPGKQAYYKCSCGKLYEDAAGTKVIADIDNWGIIAAKGHTEEVVAGKAATCTETGLTDGKKCSVCGTVTVAQTAIPLIDHSYGSDEVCDVCGYDKSVPHVCSPELVTEVAATCTEPGKQAYYKCSCGKFYEDAAGTKVIADIDSWGIIAAKGHKERVVKTKATTIKNGSIVSSCETCGAVLSSDVIYKASNIKLSYSSVAYNGKKKTAPKIIVKDSKGKVISADNYTVVKPKVMLKAIGNYNYTVKFKGNYTGSKKLTLTIKPVKPAIQKPVAAKKAVTVKWKKTAKVQTTGYQVMVATNKNFTKNVKKAFVKYGRTSYKMTKLKAKQTYYVKVRTYKTVKGVKIYSNWSAVKYVKTK